MNKAIKEFRERYRHCSCGLWLTEFAGEKAPRPKEIENWIISKLAEKDQVIDKLIEDRPFDIKDALDAQIDKLKTDLQYTTKDKATLERISNILKSYE